MAEPSLNPSRFMDAVSENFYPRGFASGALKIKRQEQIEWIWKKCQDIKTLLALADKLDACKPGSRCKSAACPECATAAQLLYAGMTERFLKQHADPNKIVCVTIVPEVDVQGGELSPQEHFRLLRRCKEALARAGVGWFVGGLDFSFNEHKEGRYPGHWCSHIHGFTETQDPEQLKRRLKEQFPATDLIRRPVKVVPWDGKRAALEYALKPEFERRIGTDNGERHDPKSGEKRTCRDVDHQPLRFEQRRELLVYLDQIGVPGRLLFRWVQFLNLRGTGPTLVLRRPAGRDRETAEKG